MTKTLKPPGSSRFIVAIKESELGHLLPNLPTTCFEKHVNISDACNSLPHGCRRGNACRSGVLRATRARSGGAVPR
jgi:hypothetical protein